MGIEEYATPIIDHINLQLKEKLFSHSDIIARDSTINDKGLYKSVSKIFPSNYNCCIILDDREDVWEDSSYLLQIAEYNFNFKESQFDCFLEISSIVFNLVHDVFFIAESLGKQISTNVSKLSFK
jgi:TFIIF-interacting CTD phosphatase-like protein